MGVSDLAVPKRIQKLGEVYYGRSSALDSALSGKDEARLAETLRRAIPAADGREVAAEALAAYIVPSSAALATAPKAMLMMGDLPFADPAAFIRGGENR